MVRWVHLLRMCCQVWSHDSQASLVRPQGSPPEGRWLSCPCFCLSLQEAMDLPGPCTGDAAVAGVRRRVGAWLRREPRGWACEDQPDFGLCRAALGL